MRSFAAYIFLVLSLFFAFTQGLPIPQSLPTRNVTISFNSSDVKFSPVGWEVVSSLPSQPSSLPFTFTNVIGATVGVSLPNGTVSVDYIGLPRSAGAAYGVCVDCDLIDEDLGSWYLINGNERNLIDDDQAAPTVLFSIVALDPKVVHTLTVTNIPDTRFRNTSQLTFQSLNIKVVDNGGANSGGSEPTNSTSPSDSSSPLSSTEPTSSGGSENPETTGTATSPANDQSESGTNSASAPAASSSSVAEHDKSPPQVATSTSSSNLTQVSNSVVALSVVVCLLVLFCLAVALILTYRHYRKRAAAKIDAESQAYGNSQWLTPKHMPFTGMQEVPLTGTPVRPRNPFENQFPPDVPLELETPGGSTLMNKRGDRRPRSSFGNNLHSHYGRGGALR